MSSQHALVRGHPGGLGFPAPSHSQPANGASASAPSLKQKRTSKPKVKTGCSNCK